MASPSPDSAAPLLGSDNNNAQQEGYGAIAKVPEADNNNARQEGHGAIANNDASRPCFMTKWSRKRIIISSVCGLFAAIVITMLVLFLVVMHKSSHMDPVPERKALPPNRPAAMTLIDANCTALHMSWQAPYSSAQILHYVVKRVDGNADPRASQLFVDAPDHEVVVGSLLGNMTCCFSVYACSSVGCGNSSSSACFKTAPPQVPATVNAPHVLSTTNASIQIGWDEVDNMGSPVDQYEVDSVRLVAADASERRYSFNALDEMKNYSFMVRAHNAVGYGNWSKRVTFHTNSRSASIPQEPLNLQAVEIGRSFATLQWEKPQSDGGAEILGYRFQIAPSAEGEIWTDNSVISISGLTTNSDYSARVRAQNGLGVGNWSSSVSFKTRTAGTPLAPSKIEITQTTATSLAIEWDIPDNQGDEIVGYEVYMDDGWFGYASRSVLNTSSTFANLTDHLVPASTYRVKVRAYNSIGAGSFSSEFEIQTDESGACGNSADVAIFSKRRDTILTSVRNSFIECITSGVDCAVDNIMKQNGLSRSCAVCWGNFGECALNKCAVQCVFPKSDACYQCSQTKCFKTLCLPCTGLPFWLLDGLTPAS